MKTQILRLLLFLMVANATNIQGQTYRYLVKFKDKTASPYSVSNPLVFLSQKSLNRRFRQGIPVSESDFPPNPAYIAGVKATGASVRYKTRWLNGVLVDATDAQKNTILALPYVGEIEFNKPLKQLRNQAVKNKFEVEETQTLNYGDATAQISLLGVDAMHNAGFHGENMLIGILDNGFLNANAITCLDTTFSKSRVLEVYDFVDKDSTVFSQGGHGTNVMSCMAGYVPNTLIAPAFGAKFVLYRTEDDATETRAEEANWLFAAERADSIGVDVINSSLGYSQFDNVADDYSKAQMDGNTALSTRAADLAVSKGIVVVNSAGNAGATAWHIISAPSDGDSVLAIGAVNRLGQVVSFSSRGNAADGAVKPDVMAVGSQTALCATSGSTGTSNGTSFSSPLTAAMVAGFWQANPHLTAFDVIQCIRKSGHIYNTPNIDYGYGYANFVRADSVAKAQFAIKSLEPFSEVKSICITPDNKAKVEFHFDTSLVGHQLRITFIDQANNLLLNQQIFTPSSQIYTLILPFNSITKDIFCRIDDITSVRNVGILRF